MGAAAPVEMPCRFFEMLEAPVHADIEGAANGADQMQGRIVRGAGTVAAGVGGCAAEGLQIQRWLRVEQVGYGRGPGPFLGHLVVDDQVGVPEVLHGAILAWNRAQELRVEGLNPRLAIVQATGRVGYI